MTQPFGGYKLSGQGCDKRVESLISYTRTKSAWLTSSPASRLPQGRGFPEGRGLSRYQIKLG
jgi:hypothetical protein